MPRPGGRRPVILLARDSAYNVRTAVTVALITRTIRSIPVEVLLDKQDGLPAKCVVNLDVIMTIPIQSLSEQITILSRDKMKEVNRSIAFALDLWS